MSTCGSCGKVYSAVGPKGDTGLTGPTGQPGATGGGFTMENYKNQSTTDVYTDGSTPISKVFATGVGTQTIYYNGTLYFSAAAAENIVVTPYHGITSDVTQTTNSTIPIALGLATTYLAYPVSGVLTVANAEDVGFKIVSANAAAVVVLLGTDINFSRA